MHETILPNPDESVNFTNDPHLAKLAKLAGLNYVLLSTEQIEAMGYEVPSEAEIEAMKADVEERRKTLAESRLPDPETEEVVTDNPDFAEVYRKLGGKVTLIDPK